VTPCVPPDGVKLVEPIRTERRWVALTLVALLLMTVSRSLPAPAPEAQALATTLAAPAVIDEAGGRRPGDVKICALALGLLVGGAAGMGVNPMMGAACISWGFHVALVTCI
jgi:hypothetical protein